METPPQCTGSARCSGSGNAGSCSSPHLAAHVKALRPGSSKRGRTDCISSDGIASCCSCHECLLAGCCLGCRAWPNACLGPRMLVMSALCENEKLQVPKSCNFFLYTSHWCRKKRWHRDTFHIVLLVSCDVRKIQSRHHAFSSAPEPAMPLHQVGGEQHTASGPEPRRSGLPGGCRCASGTPAAAWQPRTT